MKKQKTILLFDGNNLINSSFHAIKDLATSNGTPTNALYGSLKSFRATIQRFKPDYVIVCWDSGKKTFRHEQDDTYKATRAATPDALKSQFGLVQQGFTLLGVPQITAHNVECDDLIGTLAVKSAKMNLKVTIVSSDKDFYQLCDDNINVFSFQVRRKDDNGIVDANYVREHFEVEPTQLVDIKALTGEKTDNIHGVKGIGQKTATRLIKQHGTVRNVISVLQNNLIIPERHKIILESLPVIANAYRLAKIRCDVEMSESPIVTPVGQFIINENNLRDFFLAYELKQFIAELNVWSNLFKYKITLV